MCGGKISDVSGLRLVVAVTYGYAKGHPRRQANEALLRDVLTWLGALTCPSVLAYYPQ